MHGDGKGTGNRLGRVEGTEVVELGEEEVHGGGDMRSPWKIYGTCHVKKKNIYSKFKG